MTLNKKTNGTELYKVTYTPKGTTERRTVGIYAKNRLDASNYLILNKMFGKQHSIEYATANLLH